jgi:hypothetical protein
VIHFCIQSTESCFFAFYPTHLAVICEAINASVGFLRARMTSGHIAFFPLLINPSFFNRPPLIFVDFQLEMWRHRRKDKEDANGAAENISPPNEGKSTPASKEEKKGGIRKKILQFSGLGHHQAAEVKMSNSELKKLEQAKQLLFKQGSLPHQCKYFGGILWWNLRRICVKSSGTCVCAQSE